MPVIPVLPVMPTRCHLQEFLSLGVLSLTITLGLFFVKDASRTSSGISFSDQKKVTYLLLRLLSQPHDIRTSHVPPISGIGYRISCDHSSSDGTP